MKNRERRKLEYIRIIDGGGNGRKNEKLLYGADWMWRESYKRRKCVVVEAVVVVSYYLENF